VIGGGIGAAYGPLIGGLITWGASLTAAVLMFSLIRYGFAAAGNAYLAKFPKLERFTQGYERNAFLTILFARMIPVLPAAAVNIYSGLTTVPFRVFFVASAIGKLPEMLVFALVGDQLLNSWRHLGVTLLLYGLFLLVVYAVYRRFQK
jgi:uncharacterized membrane protein YdjX (TVP38/TMEM64 family)